MGLGKILRKLLKCFRNYIIMRILLNVDTRNVILTKKYIVLIVEFFFFLFCDVSAIYFLMNCFPKYYYYSFCLIYSVLLFNPFIFSLYYFPLYIVSFFLQK